MKILVILLVFLSLTVMWVFVIRYLRQPSHRPHQPPSAEVAKNRLIKRVLLRRAGLRLRSDLPPSTDRRVE